MKRIISLSLLSCLFIATFINSAEMKSEQQNAPLPTREMDHVGIIVKDIDATLDNWVKLFALETRPNVMIAAGDSKNPTQFRGKPSDAKAKLAFISLNNMKIELIEPIGEGPSHWHEFLETKGEGVHHFGFFVPEINDKQLNDFDKCGHCLLQHGGWETGEYGYMDSHKGLGVTIELLENYNKE